MTKRRTVENWTRRIERVMAHIDRNIDRDIDLTRLSEVAAFSPFHFHRIYRTVTGETVADTVRRRRFERAADDLLRGEKALVAIARRAGYGSVSAFARAFRAFYGMPPVAYRLARRRPTPTALQLPQKETEIMIDVAIQQRPPLRLAGIRHVGPYKRIGAAFDKLAVWRAAHGLDQPAGRLIAIYHDDAKTVPASKLRADACVSVGSETKVGDGAAIVELAGGRYAVYRHRGPYAELEEAYERLFREWFPQSGEEPADAPCYDDYINDPRSTAAFDLLTDICVPLKPRRK